MWHVSWSYRVSRETESSPTQADAALVSEIQHAMDGMSCAIEPCIVSREVVSDRPLHIECDSLGDAEEQVYEEIERRLSEANLPTDGIEVEARRAE